MSESDIQIGFEKEPADLEGFLEEQGYFLDDDGYPQIYEHSGGRGPAVFYYSPLLELSDADKESGCLDWGKSGYKIVSELDITFPQGYFDVVDEAVRLSEEIVKKLDGILYHSLLDDFLRKDNL